MQRRHTCSHTHAHTHSHPGRRRHCRCVPPPTPLLLLLYYYYLLCTTTSAAATARLRPWPPRIFSTPGEQGTRIVSLPLSLPLLSSRHSFLIGLALCRCHRARVTPLDGWLRSLRRACFPRRLRSLSIGTVFHSLLRRRRKHAWFCSADVSERSLGKQLVLHSWRPMPRVWHCCFVFDQRVCG